MATLEKSLSIPKRSELIWNLMWESYEKCVRDHPFFVQLKAGRLERSYLRGFVICMYAFVLEVNSNLAKSLQKEDGFLREHQRPEDILCEKIADELTNPDVGGHSWLMLKLGKALGLSREDLAHAQIPPEARAHIDTLVRMANDGTFTELWALALGEQWVGIYSQEVYEAMITHYGLTPEEAIHFYIHGVADLAEHEDGIMGHADGDRLLMEKALETGYGDECIDRGLEYMAVALAETRALLFDAVMKYYGPGQGDPLRPIVQIDE